MPAFSASVRLSGFREARAKLKQTPPFHAEAVRKFLDQLGRVGVAAVQGAAPRGKTGQLASQNVYKVQERPFPTSVRVQNKARARGRVAKRQNKKARAGLAPLRYTKGYPYAGRLNYDPKYRTHGWWTRAIRAAQNRVDSLLTSAGQDIEREWRS
jgi:hypothetical protein